MTQNHTERLEGILKRYNINTKTHHDVDNPLSVFILIHDSAVYKPWITGTQFSAIVDKTDYELQLPILITDIQEFCIMNMTSLTRVDSLVCELEKVKQGISEDNKVDKERTPRELYDSITALGFEITEDFLTYTGYIPINYILKKNRLYIVNPDVLKEAGYGITEFRLHNHKTLRGGIYCKGNHPNVSPNSHKFCMEYRMEYLSLTPESLARAKGLMSCINMDYCYSELDHAPILEPLMKEGRKIDV